MFERSLDVLDPVLRRVRFEVSLVQPPDELGAERDDPDADFGHGLIEHFGVGEALPTVRLLEQLVERAHLVLGHASGALTP
jgi:hypothetical protein